MYLLDTDTVGNFLDTKRGYEKLRLKILHASPHTIWVSIISIEEIIRGVLSLLTRARKHPRNGAKIVEYYTLLHSLVHDLGRFQILPYDTSAEAEYQEIPSSIRQHHVQDSHIAAIALANDLTVVTCNTRHFSTIPELRFEDWSV